MNERQIMSVAFTNIKREIRVNFMVAKLIVIIDLSSHSLKQSLQASQDTIP